MKLEYRADIDGIRAIAVLTVIFFHADIPGFTGGFVGVDVFFVISGFLITSIILQEIESGKFSIGRFYERRVRRIFPALFPVIAFTVVAGLFILDYKTFKKLGQSVTSTTLFASNILFWKDAGYFDAPSAQKPLLHTWSLAVEEQFYIFFPLLLVAINRFLGKRYFLYLIPIAVLSFLTSIWSLSSQPDAAFYLVQSRTWELLTGSFLALGVIPPLRSRLIRNGLSIAGIALIFYSVFFYSRFTAFPGINAIAPVLGTALLIYSGIGGTSGIGRLLSSKPVVYTGLLSYSLYLWHWPLIVFLKYLTLRSLNPLEISGLILLTFIISALSLKFIERPFRGNQPAIPERKTLFTLAAAIMVIASATGLAIHLQNGMPYRSGANAAILKSDHEQEWKNAIKTEQNLIPEICKGNAPPVIGSGRNAPVFLLWGDSHARELSVGIAEKARQYELSGFLATNSGAPPVIIDDNDTKVLKGTRFFNGKPFNDGVVSFLKSHPEVKTVIISCRWSMYAEGSGHEDGPLTWHAKSGPSCLKSNAELLKDGIVRTVNILHGLGRNIVLVSDNPELGGDALRLFCVSSLTGANYDNLMPTLDHYRKSDQAMYELFGTLAQRPYVMVISPEKLLFDSKGKAMLTNNNIMLYNDDNHLSHYGSILVASVFDDLFKKIGCSLQKPLIHRTTTNNDNGES